MKRVNKLFVFMMVLAGITGLKNPASGQGFKSMKQSEDTLAAILSEMNKAGSDSLNEILNQRFSRDLFSALLMPASDSYTFESIKTLIKVAPDDNKFRIYHWNLPSGNGKKRCYGYIKLLNRKNPVVITLHDFSDSISSPETAILEPGHWFGALYYTVISCENEQGGKFYTLLGWAGNNATITQKVIEIIYFDDKDLPHFGLPVFPDYEKGSMTRVIFRYAATTSMSLKYEEQITSTRRKWNVRSRVFDTISERGLMIVGDHLIPLDPQLEGQYQYYVPAGEVCDGFQFVKGNWHFVKGLETRNKH